MQSRKAERAALFRDALQGAHTLDHYPDWRARSKALLSYLVDVPPGLVITDLEDIEQALRQKWGLPTVRISSSATGHTPTGQFHPTRREARSLGRFSMRRLALTTPGDGYIAVDAAHYPRRGHWMMLHELGHVALHWSALLAFSDAYRRICISPTEERDVWSTVAARFTPARMEAEADLFAARWLLLARHDPSVDGLSKRGQLTIALEHAMSGRTVDCGDARKVVEANLRGEEISDEHRGGPYPAAGPLHQRAAWAMVNIGNRDLPHLLRSILAPDVVAPTPLRRIRLADLSRIILEDHWDPLMVVAHDGSLPKYYIPIASIPRPGSSASDLELAWRHLMKPTFHPGRPLQSWTEQAQNTGEGLMVFARTPAERALDAEGRFRF